MKKLLSLLSTLRNIFHTMMIEQAFTIIVILIALAGFYFAGRSDGVVEGYNKGYRDGIDETLEKLEEKHD